VKAYADKKARFIAAVCSDLGDKLEATYYFVEKPGMDMEALRIVAGKDEVVPSISGIYLTAVLNENEMQELFGLKIKDIAIDFGGHMLLGQDSPTLPMLKMEKKASLEKESE
jgi:Ni,Fe-hydrogenase III component G